MRIALCLAAALAVTGCQKAETPPAEPTEAAAVATPTSPALAGTYNIVDKDKKQSTLVIAADNTYSYTAETASAKGTVAVKDGKGCYDPEGDKDPVMCWTNSEPAADGSWTATSDDGQVVTVTRAAS